ncbi:MAG: CBS domain-containing protein [Crocinitomicaceae bacterium]|nr:CBS domain-containing protein [Crocinitomicaceae bacterium]
MITAQNILNKEVPFLKPEDTPMHALNLMDEFRVADMAVVEDGKFIGMVSETDLLSVKENVRELLHSEDDLSGMSVGPQEHILDVLKTASTHRLSIIPVVDTENTYVGVITLEDLVEQLSQLQGAGNPGGIIVLEMNENDYSLQQIARIVEENDAKILSVSIGPSEEGRIEINLKINQPDLNPILQSFSRFNYEIKGSYQEEEYRESLKKRYDELMRYLSI